MEEIVIQRLEREQGHTNNLTPCIRFTYKILYINNAAGKLFPFEWAKISIISNGGKRFLKISPSQRTDPNAFKLANVCETEFAKRIESNRSLEAILNAGFPRSLLGKNIPILKWFDGSIIADINVKEV